MTTNPGPGPSSDKAAKNPKGTRRNVSNKALYRAIEDRLEKYDMDRSTSITLFLDAVRDEWFADQA